MKKIIIALFAIFGLVVIGALGSNSQSNKAQVEGVQVQASSIPAATAFPPESIIGGPVYTYDENGQVIARENPSPIPSVEPELSNNNTYINSGGNEVHSPAYSNGIPAGATAVCGDGTYSFSQSRRGTCSHHGGVSQWL